jgi:hypothetical protein
MGGAALAALVTAEAAAALLADEHTLSQSFLSGHSAILLGLLAQLGFAIFPALRRRRGGF